MNQLLEIDSIREIATQFQSTPIATLIECHNLDKSFDKYEKAELLVGMCMDHRKRLNIPENFTYIIRTGSLS